MKMRLMIMLMAILFSLESAQTNTLMAGSRLEKNQRLYSSKRNFYLTLRGDGNLCIQTPLHRMVWCNMVFGFRGASSALTTEGNFEVYDENKVIKWSTKTHPNYDVQFKDPLNKPVKLVVQDDGTFALLNAKNVEVWSNERGASILEPNMQFMSSQTKAIITDFYKSLGNQTLSQKDIYILTTRFAVEDLVKASNYRQAKIELDKLWALFPVGSPNYWSVLYSEDRLYNTSTGHPTAYHALRMLTNIVDYKLKNIKPVDVLTSTFRVVLAKCVQGILPKTFAEYQSNIGHFQKRMLDSKLTENNYRMIYTHLDLFINYINAITDGKLNYVVKITEVNTCVEVGTRNDGRAGLKAGPSSVLDLIPQEIHAESDIYWLTYPSATPVDGEYGVAANAGFNKIGFITGGQAWMGATNKPVFTSDDNSITKSRRIRYKSEVEQRTEFFQWMMHEFFHAVFNLYLELNLEPLNHSHIWFERTLWPKDFQGIYEPDYFHEAVFRRLKQHKPILAVTLNPTLLERLKNSLNINMFIGKTFDCSAAHNPPNFYHYAKIIQENNRYYWWLYKGNIKWEIVEQFRHLKLETRNDCPFKGSTYEIVLETKDTGEITGKIVGLRYQGSLYKMT